jgi:hypothetical protein
MPAAELGNNVLARLRDCLNVETECTENCETLEWRLWGAAQRAWLETTATSDGVRTKRLQLRTGALEWFPGSFAQLSKLSTEVMLPTLGGVIRNIDLPAQLELATSVEVHENTIEWALRMISVARQVQALEARLLSQSPALARVGLLPMVDVEAKAPAALRLKQSSLLRGKRMREEAARSWGDDELDDCIEVFSQMRAQAVRTPRGLQASFRASARDMSRSVLEVTTDWEDPLIGRGLLVVLRTPARGGPLKAMTLNESEVGPLGRGHALGGWWAPEGGLLHHCSFYPDAIYERGLILPLLVAYVRRAEEADALLTRKQNWS